MNATPVALAGRLLTELEHGAADGCGAARVALQVCRPALERAARPGVDLTGGEAGALELAAVVAGWLHRRSEGSTLYGGAEVAP